jgi:hypothetical protein
MKGTDLELIVFIIICMDIQIEVLNRASSLPLKFAEEALDGTCFVAHCHCVLKFKVSACTSPIKDSYIQTEKQIIMVIAEL